MKTMDYSDFSAHLPDVVSDVATFGDIVRIINPNGENFVVMEEAEYNIMLEALRMVFAASGAATPDEQSISLAELNRNLDILR